MRKIVIVGLLMLVSACSKSGVEESVIYCEIDRKEAYYFVSQQLVYEDDKLIQLDVNQSFFGASKESMDVIAKEANQRKGVDYDYDLDGEIVNIVIKVDMKELEEKYYSNYGITEEMMDDKEYALEVLNADWEHCKTDK